MSMFENNPTANKNRAARRGFTLVVLAFFSLGLVALVPSVPTFAQEPTKVQIDTTMGSFVLELYPDKAPATVENFLAYVSSGFYEGTIFHRVIDGFMIQGGGFDASLTKKPTQDPIKNEAENGLSNERGTISMARTSDPHSATAQFFVNLVDNGGGLDQGKTGDGWGYAVFGKVISGMEVVDEIGKTQTQLKNGMRDVPSETVVIEKISVVD